jgi:type I restriction enzyme S subunit
MSKAAKTIGSEFVTYAGGTPSRANPNFFKGSVPWVKSTECNYREVNHTEEYISELALRQSSAKLVPVGSVLVAMYGATAGQISYLNIEAATNQAVLSIIPNDKYDSKFIYYWLNFCKERLIYLAQGSGQPNLNKGIVDSVGLPDFSLNEQKKIAQILAAIDGKIEVTEKLIKKKELQRNGLVENIMIGGPGWEKSQLQSLASVVSGGTPSRAVPEYWGDDHHWVTPTDITSCGGNYLHTTKEKISDFGLRHSSAKLLPIGTVLMTSRATLGESKIALFPVCTNQGFKSLVPNNGVDSAFLMYQMRRMKGLYANLGIGTTFLEVNKKDTDKFSIPIPKLESEQKRISSIFLLMDDEIESEERILKKLISYKQGLMQDLLTRKLKVN